MDDQRPPIREAKDCPTCSGWVLSRAGKMVRVRKTVGMVCPTCGTDYAPSVEGE